MHAQRHATPQARSVIAAQAGDREELDALIADHLPLVYNVVGRALGGHADVDDVVQETMLRAVQRLGDLRDPDAFRPWLISIAIRQVRERGRARGVALARQRPLDEWPDPEDPDADFVDETITRLGLADERRDVAVATRWLGTDERRLLSLWWQEVGGTLTRSEVAAALGVSQPHAAVRIQRMKNHLDQARSVLRAWRATPRCDELTEVGRAWRGQFDPLWLKRLGRHVRDCDRCATAAGPLVPAEHLLTGVSLLPVPALLAAKVAGLAGSTTVLGTGLLGAAGTTAVGGLRRVLELVSAKPAAVAGTALVGAATAVTLSVYYLPGTAPEEPRTALPPAATAEPASSAAPTGMSAATAAPASPADNGPPPLTGVAAADIYVAPDGNDNARGTLAAPLATLAKAVAVVKPGQTIALRGGIYRPDSPVTISTNGTAAKRITLSNYRDEHPILDASKIKSNQWYVTHRAAYWTVQGIEIYKAPSYPYVCEGCQHSVFRLLDIHDNGATGLMLRGENVVGNLVVDGDFHDNHDASGGGADGIAFKDGTGTGNVVRDCRAFRNSDDGLDLSGFASPVRIDRLWAYGNGVNRWGIEGFTGGGNGLQLGGGDPTPNVAHVVVNSAAWDNTGYGFTEQNNKGDLQVSYSTAFRNGKDGFAFWHSPAQLSHNLALANRVDTNRGDGTAKETDNSWQQDEFATTDLRSGDHRPAELPRHPDGTLPNTTFLISRRPGFGAPMNP